MLETLFEERLADIQVDLKALKRKARATVKDIYGVGRELITQHGGQWATIDKLGRVHVKDNRGSVIASIQVVSIKTMEILVNLGGMPTKPEGYERNEYWMIHQEYN